MNKSKTALITGASSGIGEFFARKLAAENYNLILIARRQEKLEKIAAELESKNKIAERPLRKVKIIPADLSEFSEIEKIEKEIDSLSDLEMLINNAGFGTAGYFSQADFGKQMQMLHLHIDATVRLTRAALPKMLAQKHGFIINVSSVAGFSANPNNVMYCSTKAFQIIFSKALSFELKNTGVKVQALCPGYTYTEFHDTEEYKDFNRTRINKIFWMPAEEVVDISLKSLAKNKVICIPGWHNRLAVALLQSPLNNLSPFIRKLVIKKSK